MRWRMICASSIGRSWVDRKTTSCAWARAGPARGGAKGRAAAPARMLRRETRRSSMVSSLYSAIAGFVLGTRWRACGRHLPMRAALDELDRPDFLEVAWAGTAEQRQQDLDQPLAGA